ncbi:MAG: TlpA disulfide reductase family protein [Candidatus Latescibacterota bacterium]
MADRGGSPTVLVLTAVTGVLLGTSVFLGAKITNPPPLDWMDVEYYDILGQSMPAVPLETVSGVPVTPEVLAGTTHVVVLVLSGCRACEEVYPVLREVSERLSVVLVGKGERAEFVAKVAEAGLTCPAAFDSAGALAKRLGVTGYPTAILVDQAGRILKAGSVRRILERAEHGRRAVQDGRTVGLRG